MTTLSTFTYNRLSIAITLLFSISLILGLLVREQWLWMDEVLSFSLIADPSLAHLNDAIVSNMDANPPLFPNLYWLLGHAISLNPIFLRALSVLLFAGAMALFYRYTTRLVGNPALNFVMLCVIVYWTYQNFAHSTEIRSYALLLLLSCVYFILLHRLISQPTSTRLLVQHTCIALLLAYCHNYGLFYLIASGAFFSCLWLWSGDRRYLLTPLSLVGTGLIWLLTWYPSFAIQSAAGKPHSWIPLPTLASFFISVGELIPSPFARLEFDSSFWWLAVLRVVLLFGLIGYLIVPGLRSGFATFRRDQAYQFLVLSGFLFTSILLISLAVSLTYVSVFIARYMWPSQLLIAYILIYAFYKLIGERPWMTRGQTYTIPLFTFLMGGALFHKVDKIATPFRSELLSYLPQLDNRYPLLVERADYFLPIWFHHQRNRVIFVMDWTLANHPGNIRNTTTDYKILQSMRAEYGIEGIIPSSTFNAHTFPHFYVIDEDIIYQIEHFIRTGQVRVINQLPIGMSGHHILECTFQQAGSDVPPAY